MGQLINHRVPTLSRVSDWGQVCAEADEKDRWQRAVARKRREAGPSRWGCGHKV